MLTAHAMLPSLADHLIGFWVHQLLLLLPNAHSCCYWLFWRSLGRCFWFWTIAKDQIIMGSNDSIQLLITCPLHLHFKRVPEDRWKIKVMSLLPLSLPSSSLPLVTLTFFLPGLKHKNTMHKYSCEETNVHSSHLLSSSANSKYTHILLGEIGTHCWSINTLWGFYSM